MQNPFEWYGGLSPWIRFSVAGLFLLYAGIMLAFGRFSVWGWAVGIALLIFSFPSRNERKGYHDL
jgi:hypothetical protein